VSLSVISNIRGDHTLSITCPVFSILRNFFVDQDWTFAASGGVDIMLTPNLGAFVSVVKLFYEADAGGFLLNTNIPIRTHVKTDPWFPMVGLTFKY